ncbi:PucR family transcriptional regulator [Deinococcus yavapaiensis]|uniref:PucR-like helix-turn-helix protein n=1 Tax=Deinococcus yavapaiensis KR-236 TaxID=694435 RepID=A0A318S756_9DEIO|nr:helix-turn-helix domain-containing protein [Deinococcus yavapaiensis]PYE53517.1 PucR-like helix-turn-helix protein [Deinococcus yavapaiensis KR-236]
MKPSPLSRLLATLAGPKPERDLVTALEELTGGEAAILAPWGDVLAGHVTREAVRREARDEGRLLGVVVSSVDSDVVDVAAEVYVLAALRRAARTAHVGASGEALLAELVSGARSADVRERLEAAGLEGEPFAVAALELPLRRARSRLARSALQNDLERLRSAGDAYFAALGYRFVSGVRGPRVVWLWATSDPDAQANRLCEAILASTNEDVRLGVSEAQPEPEQGRHAFTQALLALSATTRPRSSKSFARLDPLHWMLASQPHEHLTLWRETLLRPLKAHDEDGRLLETLRAYLQDSSHLGALSARLNVHPNTLRYRLGRIEELLGQPLSHPATLARLYLALGVEG